MSTPTLFGLSPELIIKGAFNIVVKVNDLTVTTMSIDESVDDLLAYKEVDESSPIPISPSEMAAVPDPGYVTYIDYDDPFVLMNEKLHSPHIVTLSTFAWVDCGDHHYVLECLGKGFMKIEPYVETYDEPGIGGPGLFHTTFIRDVVLNDTAAAQFIAYFTRANLSKTQDSPYLSKQKILTAATLNDAIRGCDTYVRNKVGPGDLFQM